MKKITAKRSSLFLLELIIAILFFTLSSAVCIQLFAASHLKATETTALNMAITKAQSAAEGIRATDGSMDALQKLFTGSLVARNTLTAYYDESWNSCQSITASYEMQVVTEIEHSMTTATISVLSVDTSEQIYQLSVKKYIANRRPDYEP